MFRSFRCRLISKTCIPFFNSAINVHDSQTYRNMEMTRERTRFIFDLIDLFLSLHIGFCFVRAAVACSILGRTSGFDPLSETIATRFEGCYSTQLLFLYLDLPLDAIDAGQDKTIIIIMLSSPSSPPDNKGLVLYHS